jgi:succinoglycan biosynthesis transport protein ExoP
VYPHDSGYPDSGSGLPPTGRDLVPFSGRQATLPGGEPPEGGPPPGLAASPGPWELLRALRRRWVMAILLGGGLATLAACAVWFLLSPDHTAFTRLQVKYQEPHIIRNQDGTNRNEFGTYLRTKAAQIMSRPVIWSALKQEDVKRLGLEARYEDPVAFVEENLLVDFQDTNEMMTVLMASSDPHEATTLVKAITGSFMDQIVYAENRARVHKVNELEKVYNDAVEDLKKRKDNLRKLERTLGTTDPMVLAQQRFQLNESIRDLRQQRNRIGSDYLKAQANLEAFEAQAKAVREAKLSKDVIEAALARDSEVKRLQQEIGDIELVVQDYLDRGASTRMPTLVRAQATVARLKEHIESRRDEVRAALERDFKASTEDAGALTHAQLTRRVLTLKELHDQLQGELEDLVKQANTLVTQTIPEHEARRDEITRQEEVVNEIGHRLEKERVELRSAPRITLFQDADLQPKNIKKQLLATIGAPILVLVAVCLGLAWFEYRQRRVRSAGEVARGLGIRVVGAIPAVPDLQRHVASPLDELELEGHPVLESVDAIRTLLLRDAHANATRTVLVTSAASGEGKTTLAGHLASSLARAGRRTLLIDSDLRNPVIHDLFEVPLQPGFSELLLGEVEVADVVQPTALADLSLMTAGHWDRDVLHALARGGVEAIFEKLEQEFDFIILDSHPVLHATDSLLIGQHVDAVLLSVLREISQTPRVYVAASRLSALGIRVLGAVVSGADPEEVITPSLMPALAA